MDNKELFAQLLRETQRRQRRKTDLSEFDSRMREMMDLNISLPVILEWLARQPRKTTLPALRRYVKRVFGEAFYDEFLERNGWMKTKSEKKLKQQIKGVNQSIEKSGIKPTGTVGQEVLVQHVGISKTQEVLMQPPTKYPPRKNN